MVSSVTMHQKGSRRQHLKHCKEGATNNGCVGCTGTNKIHVTQQRHRWLTGIGSDAYPAPEPDLIEQLSKCDVPGNSCSPDSEVSTSNILSKETWTSDNDTLLAAAQ